MKNYNNSNPLKSNTNLQPHICSPRFLEEINVNTQGLKKPSQKYNFNCNINKNVDNLPKKILIVGVGLLITLLLTKKSNQPSNFESDYYY